MTDITANDVMQFAPEFYTALRNPVWANEEHTAIDCEVNFKHVAFEEWTPFHATDFDHMPYTLDILNRCKAGEFGPVGEYVSRFSVVDFDPLIAANNQPTTTGSQDL